ncbi:DUF2974 domain-containing protein [Roseburia hominis]
MGNIIDYLRWRGDLTFAQSPFNNVDNLILSQLSYVNLDGIAPGEGEEGIPIEELSDIFFQKYSPEELKKDRSFLRRAPEIIKEMAKTVRYRDAVVKNFVNRIDEEKELQFAALEICLSDGTSYIAYRGTDDTIVGWKEDFNLSKGVILSEEAAVIYLDHFGELSRGQLRIGGHSKGGNLAVYAAAMCKTKVQEKILKVYDNDGPGFADNFLEQEGFLRMKSRVERLIPEGSIIGMLLDHAVEPRYIASSQTGVRQHDGFTWQVLGPDFIYKKALNKRAALFNETLDNWLHNLEEEERNALISDFFSVMEVTGASTLTELQDGGLRNIRLMLRQIEQLNPETRERVDELIKALVSAWHKFI